MFRTVLLSIIRGFSLCTQQWYMSYRFADSLRSGSGWNWFRPDSVRKLSANLYNIYHCDQDQDGTSSVLILLASCQQTSMTYTMTYTITSRIRTELTPS